MNFNPQITCNDGTTVSVQAGPTHYSSPRSNHGPYFEVEVGFPSAIPFGEMLQYAEDPTNPTKTVYGYVPVSVVEDFINSHGGIKSGKMPD